MTSDEFCNRILLRPTNICVTIGSKESMMAKNFNCQTFTLYSYICINCVIKKYSYVFHI